MSEPFDPAVVQALERAVGHPLPLRDEEWGRITDLQVSHAYSLAGIERCHALAQLVLNGCGRVSLRPVGGMGKLEVIVVKDTALVSFDGLGDQPLIMLEASRNLLTDLTPLLAMSSLESVQTDANPLSAESYEQVIPVLRERGMRVTCSAQQEWQLTLRMQAAGLPYCCYRDLDELRLNSPGMEHTDLPEYGHPVVTAEELEHFLETDPGGIHDLFARRDRMWPLEG